MIPDEMLKKAAERSNEIYTAALEVSAPETEHTFSPEFEKKLRKLRRRVDHRILYRTLRWAACILLAVLLAGGALFVGDEGARASFVSWFKAIQSEIRPRQTNLWCTGPHGSPRAMSSITPGTTAAPGRSSMPMNKDGF